MNVQSRHDHGPVHVRIYTKPGCHLCVELVELIADLPVDNRVEVEEVNIELDEGLFEQYRYTIPVLELQDGTRFYPPHSASSVAAALHVEFSDTNL